MIELTQEQWQAIAQEENPTVTEPASSVAYSSFPRANTTSWGPARRKSPRVLRIAWMRRMRLDEEEIEEALREDPPKDIDAEMQEWRALDHLDKITPPGEVLSQFAVKYY